MEVSEPLLKQRGKYVKKSLIADLLYQYHIILFLKSNG
jgi:hypothetical protein